MRPARAAAVLGVVLLLAPGCGTDDGPAAAPTPSTAATAAGAVGRIPTGFPTAQVPLIAGVVTAGSGGPVPGEPGHQAWILELAAVGTADSCLASAERALLGVGFAKGGSMVAADTRQTQYTAPGYTVIVSARSGAGGQCQLGYEVGQD